MPIAKKWLSSHHMITATNAHTTTEELLDVVFIV
jgi:hypothetical protein